MCVCYNSLVLADIFLLHINMINSKNPEYLPIQSPNTAQHNAIVANESHHGNKKLTNEAVSNVHV